MKYTYTYDENRKHATKVTVTNTAGGAQKYAKSISYDGYDRTIKEDYGASAIGTEVNYPDGNNSPEERVETLKHIMNGTLDTTSYTYDGLNRLTQKEMEASVGIRIYRQKYAYLTGKSGTNETTGLVKSEELHEGFSTSADEKYEYTYDANGNVTEIKNLLDTGKNVSYEYDSLNRLTKETNLAIGNEWRYTYDNGGNITKKEEYNPATGALRSSWNYGYGDTYWKDQLTSWGSYGTSYFAYDSSGNPTKYKGKTLTWEGKRLTKYSASSTSNMELSYDGSGMLIGYIQSDTYTDWAGAQYTNVYSREMTRDGDRILTEKVTSIDGALLTNDVKNVKYMYDAKGASGMIVDGTKYYFRKNIFGDVVEIYNESGAKCAEYTYDAWGTCYLMLDTEGVGSLNPFRYRGYYFVSRIGLYYLTTRFYDYTTGRFINADVPSICFDDGLTLPEGCNLYSYCRNNPISYVDPTGHFAISTLVVIIMTTVGVIVGGVYAYDKAYNDGARDWELFGWTLLGAVIGGFIGFGIGRFLGSIASNLGNMSSLVGTLESVGIAVSPTSLGQVAGVIGSFILFSQNANRFKPKDSRSNKSQNKEFQRIADEFDLNEKQRRRIHDKISKKGYSKDEILEIIRKLFPWLFK
ncbi:MAG: RHS repeat domain-containing protein [Christensenellales bacterium]